MCIRRFLIGFITIAPIREGLAKLLEILDRRNTLSCIYPAL